MPTYTVSGAVYAAPVGTLFSSNSWRALGSCTATTNTSSVTYTTPMPQANSEKAGDRVEAQRRARELLLRYLDAEQKAEYEAHQRFEVVVRGRRYRITRKRSENVFLMEDGRAVERYCIHPADPRIPLEDQMLGQKLMLEAEEDGFLEVANRFRMAA